jgi:sporulation protein YlmC with PRC-barrel domain
VHEYEERGDRFTAIEDRFAGYEVYDHFGSKIGKIDDLFVDESDQPEYIGVKMGFFGTSSTLIPWETVSSVDEGAGMSR